MVKGGKKEAVTQFEATVARLAIRKGYHYVICGHIHRPVKKRIMNQAGVTTYLNSGDWVDNNTALEYEDGDWHLRYWKGEGANLTEETAVEEILSDRKSTRLNSSHVRISYAVFCLK